MFTGIIEETGTVVSVQKGSGSASLTIQGSLIFGDLKKGDTVSVSGVCLTAREIGNHTFTADVMNETFSRSALGLLRSGSRVNLERAMPADGRFGGHIVSGHIDGAGTVSHIQKDDNAVWFTIQAPPELLRYVVEKGSVAIDGISLTVATAGGDSFRVSVIPHTAAVTTLPERKIGDRVNLETDIVGKYIEKFLSPATAGDQPGLTLEFLAQAGF